MSNRVAVVACAQTELREAWSGAQHVDLISATVSDLLKGAGLGFGDIDFVIDSGSDVLDGRSISNCGFLGAMGAHHKEESRVEEDGLWAALYGVTKIASGAADVGLIIAYSKPSESDVGVFYASQCEPFYQRPVGFDHLAACGLQAQQYMSRYGATEDDLARVAAKAWGRALRNDKVQLASAPTSRDVLASPLVASPLRRLMMSRWVDGAVAILLAGADVARRLSPTPAWITGMGASMDRHAFAVRNPVKLEACEHAAKAAYKRAGLNDPSRVSIVEASASSSVGELMVMEALSIAAVGRGIELYSDSDDADSVQVNRSGGALPADPVMATGLVRLGEAYAQLTRPSDYGLRAPSSAIVHAAGGVGMQTHCVFVLEV